MKSRVAIVGSILPDECELYAALCFVFVVKKNWKNYFGLGKWKTQCEVA